MENIITFGELEIRIFALENRAFICRIGKPGDQPKKVNDAFYPAPDFGYLWFRWVDGHLACSGLVSADSFSEEQIEGVVEAIDDNTYHSEQQIDWQITLVREVRTRIESGEESLSF